MIQLVMINAGRKNWWNSAIYPTLAVMIGLVVLFVSFSRATLDIAAQENDEDKLRNTPIKFMIFNEDGTSQETEYKLPEINTLPTNPFYGFKKLRDFLWLSFSGNGISKSKVSLLLADKKMAECRELFKNNQSKEALEASQEALDKLKYADSQLKKVKEESPEINTIKDQIYMAGLAYNEILDPIENSFELDREKYKQLIGELEAFNEEQKKEKSYRMEN